MPNLTDWQRKMAAEGIEPDFEESACEGHYDDDRALLNGEYFCDGSCKG